MMRRRSIYVRRAKANNNDNNNKKSKYEYDEYDVTWKPLADSGRTELERTFVRVFTARRRTRDESKEGDLLAGPHSA